MSIAVTNLVKRFGSATVCDHLNLDIPSGQLVALLGPSGSGKTTLLRIIAGLEQPDSGTVLFDGEDATDVAVPKRKVGFVFQHYALFGHLTIFENIAFGLRVRPKANRPSNADIQSKVQALLKLVQLEGVAQRYPHQLSGGQRQRIALARALAVEPKVLLLDEPFGALDAQVRKELRRWLRQLHHDLNITSVFVTHDQEEAMEVADRIVVMNQGRIEQVGTPDEVYHHPANAFVMQFLGDVHVLEGTHGQDAAESVFVRPHHIKVLNEPEEGAVAVRWVRSLTAGPCATLLFAPINGAEEIEVVLTHDQLAALQSQATLNREALLYLKPNRHIALSETKKPSPAHT